MSYTNQTSCEPSACASRKKCNTSTCPSSTLPWIISPEDHLLAIEEAVEAYKTTYLGPPKDREENKGLPLRENEAGKKREKNKVLPFCEDKMRILFQGIPCRECMIVEACRDMRRPGKETSDPSPKRGMVCRACHHTVDGHDSYHDKYRGISKTSYANLSREESLKFCDCPYVCDNARTCPSKSKTGRISHVYDKEVIEEKKVEEEEKEEKIEKTPNKQGTRGLPPDVRVIILDGTSGRFRTMTDEELSSLDSGNNCTQTQASTNAADPPGSYAGSVKNSRPTKRKLAEVTKDAENSSTTSSSTTDPSKRPKKKVKRSPKPPTPIASPEPSNPTPGEAYDVRATKKNVPEPEPESDGVVANGEKEVGTQVTTELTLEQMRAFLAKLAEMACRNDPTFLQRELTSIGDTLNSLGAPSR